MHTTSIIQRAFFGRFSVQRPTSAVWLNNVFYDSRSTTCCLHANTNGNETQNTEKTRLVLGIESSCDDTGAAVVGSDGTIFSNVVVPQAEIHAAWGGIVPKLAQEAHEKAIDGCVQQALEAAGVRLADLDAVAVTIGPGLSLCLRVGVSKALSICQGQAIKMIPIHHMEAHALVARVTHGHVQFPFLCLLVSGGHNLLLVVEGIGRYIQLGTTLDDALGEAYDKIARILDIDLVPSGGAALEKLAVLGDPDAYSFTIPLKKRQTCDFSYAGLKTAVRLTAAEALESKDAFDQENQMKVKADIAASFQKTAVQHLQERCRRAFEWASEYHPEIKQLVVAGGVASNKYVRSNLQQVCDENEAELVCPPPHLCTDNGVMVAWAGVERLQAGMSLTQETSPMDAENDWIDLKPRWPLTERRDPRCYMAQRSAKKSNIHTSLEQLTHQPSQGI